MHWTWDDTKSRANKQKHGLTFEVARRVFDDPLAASWPDSHGAEERWQTIGIIQNVIVIVSHTWPETDRQTGQEIGRIISARKATNHERRFYEEGDN